MIGDVIHPLNTMLFGPGVYGGCYENECHFPTQLFLRCHVAMGLAFQGLG